MQIAPSVYVYPFTSYMDNGCNTVILDGSEKVLIDPGHKRHWPALKEQIEADGFNFSEIGLIIHTHCHPDHMEAGEILEKEYGITQAMGRVEAEFYKSPGMELFSMMGLPAPEGSIGRLLDPGPLELGDKTVHLHLAPGHTPGSLCIHWPQAKVLITGDVIFAQSVGRSDFPGGNQGELAKSIESLGALVDVDFLLPGHGPAVVGAEQVKANFKAVRAYF